MLSMAKITMFGRFPGTEFPPCPITDAYAMLDMVSSMAIVPKIIIPATIPLTTTDQTSNPRLPKAFATANSPAASATASKGSAQYQCLIRKADNTIIQRARTGKVPPACSACSAKSGTMRTKNTVNNINSAA